MTFSDVTTGLHNILVRSTSDNSCISSPASVTIITQPVTPTAPAVGTITQPTCAVATGSVILNNLPAGNWTINPGAIAGSTLSATVSGLTSGTYNFTVTNAAGCTSPASANVIINAQPAPPAAATLNTTQPTCTVATATIVVSAPLGAFEYNIDGGTWQASVTFSGVVAGSHNILVRNASDNSCISSPASATVNAQPETPTAPAVGTITQPTCGVATGSVVLNNLPAGNWTINPGAIAGSTLNTTISGLASGTHNFTVTNAAGCISPLSANVAIDQQPVTPITPAVTLTQPTCAVATGTISVTVQDAGETYSFDNGGSFQAGNSLSGLATGSYNIIIRSAGGCNSVATSAAINAQPPSPATPSQTTDCSLGSGNATITVTNPVGAGLDYRLDGGLYQTGLVFTGVVNGSHTITVRNTSGCTTTGSIFSVSCGCINAPSLALFSTSGNTCGTTPVTISGNTFANATFVTITENGAGSVIPATTGTSPFAFTYTPAAGDAGNTVIITITTDNPLGSPCAEATATYTLTVNAVPDAPTAGTITQPTCDIPTGSVILNGLPAGNWTINPGAVTGTGTSSTISGLAAGTYNFTVSSAAGCTSNALTNIIINPVPAAPSAPTIGTLTQPTCVLATGSVVLNGLPAGNWTINPGAITGTGANYTVAGLIAATYNFTAADAGGCTSPVSADVVINSAPGAPAPPTLTLDQPTCITATGTITVTSPTGPGMTYSIDGSNYTNTTGIFTLITANTYSVTARNTAGCTSAGTNVTINTQPVTPALPTVTLTQPTCSLTTGTITVTVQNAGETYSFDNGGSFQAGNTLSGLSAGTYNIIIRSTGGCNSGATQATVNIQPATPSAPTAGTITQPTCAAPTGSVVLSGLPAGNWTINPGAITGTGANTTVMGLAAATYNFTVTNAAGCTSSATADVVINAAPGAPSAPALGTITQPTCTVATGSVVLNGLPAGNWTINPGALTGTGTTTTISNLTTGTYNYTVTNAAGCSSPASANIIINAQPATPDAPAVGTITQPTCSVTTGSVILNNLPAGTWTINPGTITGTGSNTTISGLATGTHNFTVTSAAGCTSQHQLM